MNKIWFKQLGWLYLPVHPIGAIVTFFALAADITLFIAIDRQSHSGSDTLLRFFVYFTCVAYWFNWLAEKTSKKP